MNFLAHWILANEKDSGSNFLIGSVFPDIAKRAGFATPTRLLNQQIHDFPAIENGIRFHLEADREFHNSDLFIKGQEAWKNGLESEKLLVTKSFFLHHLLFEMWLDRILLEQFPEAGLLMYHSFEKLNSKSILHFSKDFYNDQNGLISKVWEGFKKRRFILAYTSETDFCNIAFGVFSHVTKQKPPPLLFDIILEKTREMENRKALFHEHWNNFRQDFLKL
jgi:hypothetical protein